ncbi:MULTISPECIES: hypothetical protein [unclassified Microbacterium]|uniref:hypothetical protein n=1 Tax=unclassified Microbacterium TaxID=2609290 RepID=UPI0030197DA0
MPFHEYSTRDVWVAAALDAAGWSGNAAGLRRFRVSIDEVVAVIDAEAAGADAAGLSSLTPEQVAATTGAPLRTVLLIRAGLANSGLMSPSSHTTGTIQLQLPRGTTASAGFTPLHER